MPVSTSSLRNIIAIPLLRPSTRIYRVIKKKEKKKGNDTQEAKGKSSIFTPFGRHCDISTFNYIVRNDTFFNEKEKENSERKKREDTFRSIVGKFRRSNFGACIRYN